MSTQCLDGFDAEVDQLLRWCRIKSCFLWRSERSTSNLSRSRFKRPSVRTFTFEKVSDNNTDKTSNKIEGGKGGKKNKQQLHKNEWKTEKLESLLFLLWYRYLNDQCNTQELNCFMNEGTIWESLSSRTLLERNDTYSRELFCVFNTCFPLYAFNQNRCTSRCSNNVPKNVNTFCPCAWYHWEQCHLMHKQAQLFPIEMKVQSANIMTQLSRRKERTLVPIFLFKNNYCL